MIDILNDTGSLIVVRIDGELTRDDYTRFVPWLDRRVTNAGGPVSFVVHAEDWDGWASLRAAWADLKMDTRFTGDVDRLAMVGDARWQEWLTKLSSPLVPTRVRWFDPSDADAAEAWASGKERA